MPLPTYAPPEDGDRIANLLLHLETHVAPSLTLTPLAIRRENGAIDAKVIARLTDGRRESLTPAEARTMAACLRYETHVSASAKRWIIDLLLSADAADRQAAAIVTGQGTSHLVRPARDFGSAR